MRRANINAEDKKVGDTVRGDLMAKEQQEMKNKEELVKW